MQEKLNNKEGVPKVPGLEGRPRFLGKKRRTVTTPFSLFTLLCDIIRYAHIQRLYHEPTTITTIF